jgi:hypothetical protein
LRESEDGPSPRALEVEGIVKVHDLETWGLFTRNCRLPLGRLVDERVGPLCSELGEGLALDNLGGFEGDLKWLELHSPLRHPSDDIGVAQNLLQR